MFWLWFPVAVLALLIARFGYQFISRLRQEWLIGKITYACVKRAMEKLPVEQIEREVASEFGVIDKIHVLRGIRNSFGYLGEAQVNWETLNELTWLILC